jgi:prepilin-type N-terminal cleavage/methylation domain-containing protein
MCGAARSIRGFTLIELMVTIGIAAILSLMVVPNLIDMVDSGKTSVLVNKFPQDVAWARNQAVTTQQTVSMALSSSGCDWQTTVGATAQAEHSMSNAATEYPGVQCKITNPPASGTLFFTPQGLVTDGPGGTPASPTITVTAKQGQTWILQMLGSGTVILNSNTAS